MTARGAFLQHSAYDLPGVLGDRARELGLTTESYRADHGAAGLPPLGSFDLLVVMGSTESTTESAVTSTKSAATESTETARLRAGH